MRLLVENKDDGREEYFVQNSKRKRKKRLIKIIENIQETFDKIPKIKEEYEELKKRILGVFTNKEDSFVKNIDKMLKSGQFFTNYMQ